MSRWTGWIERASVTCFLDGAVEETWTLETRIEADEKPFSSPGVFEGDTDLVQITLCIGHEDNTEETLIYTVAPGTEIIYTGYDDFTAFRSPGEKDRIEKENEQSVSFGCVYEDSVFYISAI